VPSENVECALKHLASTGWCNDNILDTAQVIFEEMESCRLPNSPEMQQGQNGALVFGWGSEFRSLEVSIDQDGQVNFARETYDPMTGDLVHQDEGVLFSDEGFAQMLGWFYQDGGHA
jgi:hypothetical protein